MKLLPSRFSPIHVIVAAMLAGSMAVIAGCGGGGGGEDAATLVSAGAGAGTGAVGGRGPAPVLLGGAANYVILAQTGITNVPASAITGNIGLSPATGAEITGLTPCAGTITGTVNTVDAAGPDCRVTNATLLTTAINNKNAAFTDAAGRAPDYTELFAGNLGGRNLGPATYKWSSAVLVPTNMTLTGGPNDVWIFQIAQGLTVSSGVQIILAGGALPQNVYWQVESAAIGTTSQFKGTVIAATDIAMTSGASIQGRLLAGTKVTLIQNVVTAP